MKTSPTQTSAELKAQDAKILKALSEEAWLDRQRSDHAEERRELSQKDIVW